MDPLFVALIMLIGGGASSNASDWQRRYRLNSVRNALGMWPVPVEPKGTISMRLDWIQSQFGTRAALLAREAAVLLGVPSWSQGYVDAETVAIAGFLPWLAWRLWQGDAPELAAVLEASGHMPMVQVATGGWKQTDYGKDEASTDLSRVLQWYLHTKPDLNKYTWEEAKNAELKWYGSGLDLSSLKLTEKPEVVWRSRLRTDYDDGDWVVIRVEDNYADVKNLCRKLKCDWDHSTSRYDHYFLLDPDRAPQAMVVEENNYNRLVSIFEDNLHRWDCFESESESLIHLREFMLSRWGDLSRWPTPEGALLLFTPPISEKRAIELLTRYPDLLSDNEDENLSVGNYIADRAGEWFSYKFVDEWAKMANEERVSSLFPEIAGNQTASAALTHWMATGEWVDELRQKPLNHDNLPGILRRYEYDPSHPDADLTDMHQGEYDVALPWELRVWEVYHHPLGPELELKVQGFVLYDPSYKKWNSVIWRGVRFRLDSMSEWLEWVESGEHEDFDFVELVGERHGSRTLDEGRIKKVLAWNSPFKKMGDSTSLDVALSDLWDGFRGSLEATGALRDEELKRYFSSQDLIEPRADIQITDVLETIDLLR